MGFSGGGSNVLKPHKHSSAVQDGSPLDMNNVTEATLSAGDVIFSDGSALQRLAVGAATDVLTVNGAATAPEWSTAASGGATLTRTSVTTSTEQSSTSASFVDITSITQTLQAGTGCAICWYQTSTEFASATYFRWDFATDGAQSELLCNSPSLSQFGIHGVTSTLSGQVVKCQFKVYTGGLVSYVQRDSYNGMMNILEIS